MSFFSLSPILFWFLVGISFLALELVLPGLIIFFFGIGAWCTAMVLYFLPMPLSDQLLVFLASSLLALLLLRSTLAKIFLGRTHNVDTVVGGIPFGATGEVIEDIVPPAIGTIKYSGSFWQAKADETLVKGTIVYILEKSNLTLKVGPIETKGEN